MHKPLRLSEQIARDRLDKLFALFERMGAVGEWQAAEQSILRLITTDSKKLKRECSFAFPNYGSFRLYRVNCKNYGVAVCCYNGQRYTTATIRTIKDVEDIID